MKKIVYRDLNIQEDVTDLIEYERSRPLEVIRKQ
jgi:hypothetical protein